MYNSLKCITRRLVTHLLQVHTGRDKMIYLPQNSDPFIIYNWTYFRSFPQPYIIAAAAAPISRNAIASHRPASRTNVAAPRSRQTAASSVVANVTQKGKLPNCRAQDSFSEVSVDRRGPVRFTGPVRQMKIWPRRELTGQQTFLRNYVSASTNFGFQIMFF